MKIARTVAITALLFGIVTPPAHAADLSVTCTVRVVGANVVANRHLAIGITYGTDVAAATITCISLTGDEYIAWVDLDVKDQNGNRIGAKRWGSAREAVGGVAVAATEAVVSGYDEGSSAPLLRQHTVIALGYVAPLCWPSCANQPQPWATFTYVA